MSIIRMATIPGNIYSAQRTFRPLHKRYVTTRVRESSAVRRGQPSVWRTLLHEGYPAIGLLLIAGYVLWVLIAGEPALPWAGELSPVE